MKPDDREFASAAERRTSISWHYGVVAVGACVGVLLSVALFYQWRGQEHDRLREDFTRAAQDRTSAVARKIQSYVLILDSIRAFYEGSREVERQEFRKFAGPILQHYPGIQALEWIPRVLDGERQAYESAARADGYGHFQITERHRQGQMVRAQRRQEHFPVYFVEPYEGNEIALGFDLASSPSRLGSLISARDSGQMVATPRITLVQEKADEFGFLIYAPIYRKGSPTDTTEARRENLTGFALGVFRAEDTLKAVLGYLEPVGIDCWLYDDSAPMDERFLCFRASERRKSPITPSDCEAASLRHGLRHTATIDVAGRGWTMVCAAAPCFFERRSSRHAWAALAAGLLITALLAGYVLTSVSRNVKTTQLARQLLEANRELERNISERQANERQLAHMASHDWLTGLPNRRLFEEALSRTVARARRGGRGVLLLFDVDDFKLVNDHLGHAAGDNVLKRISELVREQLREEDVVGRLGGDEFVVLLEGTGKAEAMIAAERVRKAVDSFSFAADPRVRVSISIGLAEIDGRRDVAALISQADAAMYAAKSQGRNQVVCAA